MAGKLTVSGFLFRLAASLVLVFATFNPSGYSFFHWVQDVGISAPVRMLIGILLTIAWVVFLRATLRSLGMVGLILVAALFSTIIWIAVDMGWLSIDNVNALSYVILVMLSFILAIGMSWSHIRRRLSGQVDVDEVDD